VEVHSIISRFIVENMDSTELYRLAPRTGEAAKVVYDAMISVYGGCDSLHVHGAEAVTTPERDLQNIMIDLEYCKLPFSVWNIKMTTLRDPHHIICFLQVFHTLVMKTCITNFFPPLEAQINSLVENCQKVLRDVYRLSRTLTQNVQRCLSEGRYHSILHSVQQYVKTYPTYSIAMQAVTLIEDVIPYFEGEIQGYFLTVHEQLQQVLPECHCFKTTVLPMITLLTNELHQIKTSLLAGSPHVEITYNDYVSGKFFEKYSSVLKDDIWKLIKIGSTVNFDQFK